MPRLRRRPELISAPPYMILLLPVPFAFFASSR
jgi:hypothetical protein